MMIKSIHFLIEDSQFSKKKGNYEEKGRGPDPQDSPIVARLKSKKNVAKIIHQEA